MHDDAVFFQAKVAVCVSEIVAACEASCSTSWRYCCEANASPPTILRSRTESKRGSGHVQRRRTRLGICARLKASGLHRVWPEPAQMSETRKLAAILVADVVGYSRLAGADEDRTLARLEGAAQRPPRSGDRRSSRAHRQAPRLRQHHRFCSVVDAVRCAIELYPAPSSVMLVCRQNGGSNTASASISASGRGERRLMGEAPISPPLEGVAKPGAICPRGRLSSGKAAARS